MKLFACMFMVYQCSPVAPQEELEQPPIVEVVDAYPVGPYGYKAAVREYWLDDGDTFPPICLSDKSGTEYCADDMDGLDGYWVIIISTDDCWPCDELEKRIDTLAEVATANLDAPVIATQKLYGIPDEFLIDAWPEVVRGYPTTYVIDLMTMEIVTEMVGFNIRPEQQPQWFDTFSFRLGVWGER